MTQKTGNYLSREESFMYDREPKFPLLATSNAVRIEYTKTGITFFESRRGTLTRISRSGGIIEFTADHEIPDSFTLDIPDARIEKMGCVKILERRQKLGDCRVSVTFRCLKVLSERDHAKILDHSALPKTPQQRQPNIVMAR